MKMLAEYQDNAMKFEKMAAEEENPTLKGDFEKQAAAYRKLAAERAKQSREAGATKFKRAAMRA